jgi:hypothetical protein
VPGISGTTCNRGNNRVAKLVTSVVAVACLSGGLAAAANAASAGDAKGGHLKALVVKRAGSPVLDALQKRQHVRMKRTGHVRSRYPRKYDMLVVDGDALSAGKMAKRRELRRFTRAHRWVLGVDLGRKHHARAIAEQTGFEALEQGGGHSSEAFLYRRALVGNTPRTLMVDAPNLRPDGSKGLGKHDRARLGRRHARDLADTVHDNIAEGDAEVAGAAPGEDAPLPPELQHAGWTYSVTGEGVPKNGYWTAGKGDSGLIFYDNPGSQTASWTMNYDFDVYLDNNPSRPTQNHQIVTYNLNGQVAPKRLSEHFFHMSDLFSAGLSGRAYNLERAWWTGTVGVDAAPDAATDGKLTWQASQPETPNAEHEYTSGQDFTVGFRGSNEGAEVSAEYGVHSDRSNSVPDWGVENQTSGNHLHWRFSSRDPCDPRPDHYDVNQCFDKAEPNGTYWGPHQPNDLSTGQLQVHSSGRWNTHGVLDGPDANLRLDVDTPITLADTYCDDFEFGVCPRLARKIDRTPVGPGPRFTTIDASKVVPVGIESLDLQDAANGSKNEKVKGTVTLEKKAPMDVTVVIYSDSPNASVGGPSGHGSQREITVKEGTTSQDFQILTNDNKLQPAAHTTANITAFYAEPTTKQLRICAGNPPC